MKAADPSRHARLQFGLDAVVEENADVLPVPKVRKAELQFGLDAVVEENLRGLPHVELHLVASIRPRRCRRGEPDDEEQEEDDEPEGFNSASTLSSRRTMVALRMPPSSSWLQFGLDAVVEENFRRKLADVA